MIRIVQIVVFVAVIVAWQFGLTWFAVPAFIVPTPLSVLSALEHMLTTHAYWYDIGVTLYEVLTGYVIAVLVGVLVGTLMAQVPVAEKILNPYFVAFQSIPKIALAPLFVIWFGFGTSGKTTIVAAIAFFPIMVNTVSGFKGVDQRRLTLMRSLGASPWQTFTKLKLPNAAPFLFAGFDIAIVFSVLGAIAGEFVGASRGLGSIIIQKQAAIDVAGVFGVLITLSIIGTILHWTIRLIAKRFVFWAEVDVKTYA